MKKGISLIVLIVTIIVIIILAAAVILTLNKNNPIDSSRVAQIADNRSSLNSAVSLYYGKKMAETQGVYESAQIFKDKDLNNEDIAKVEKPLVDATSYVTIEGTTYYKMTNTSDLLSLTLPTVTNATWYLDIDTGLVYLVYDAGTGKIPNWMYTDGTNLDTTIASFVKQKAS